jgi:5'-3' exonuclease
LQNQHFYVDYKDFLKTIENDDRSEEDGEALTSFHSKTITPGTPFFERCTEHLQHFVKRNLLHGDPRWNDLTIVFSGGFRCTSQARVSIKSWISSTGKNRERITIQTPNIACLDLDKMVI